MEQKLNHESLPDLDIRALEVPGQDFTYNETVKKLEELNLSLPAGEKPWRLPTAQEVHQGHLRSIVKEEDAKMGWSPSCWVSSESEGSLAHTSPVLAMGGRSIDKEKGFSNAFFVREK